MNQCRRLQRLPWSLFGHLVRCQLPQFFVHQRQQLFGRLLVARFNLAQNACDVGHGDVREREDARRRLYHLAGSTTRFSCPQDRCAES
jgi:hypothetical protein